MSGVLASLHGLLYAGVSSDFELISSQTLGSATASVTFSSIPSTYKHLQLRCVLMGGSGGQNFGMQLNGDTASNYSSHQLQGDGATPAIAASAPQVRMNLLGFVSSTTTYPFVAVLDLLDYANTSKFKTLRGIAGQDGNASGTATNWRVSINSGSWRSTAAVTQISVYLDTLTMGQYSTFSLYGMK